MEHVYKGIVKNFEDAAVQYLKVVDDEISEFCFVSCLIAEVSCLEGEMEGFRRAKCFE